MYTGFNDKEKPLFRGIMGQSVEEVFVQLLHNSAEISILRLISGANKSISTDFDDID
jgi:hypothetical protein